MEGKTVVLGVTGGIAAYKSVEIASRLVKKGALVHVVMTEAATRFVSPLTFRTISRNPVSYEMFEDPGVWDVLHVSLAKRADILVASFSHLLIAKLYCAVAGSLYVLDLLPDFLKFALNIYNPMGNL
jgi:phosphopantothenoylcysteine decarboxylase/phosphopantothenate--cysteine ligase